MNQVDQNINKDMSDSDLIDVESLDFSDDQTWLLKVPDDSAMKVDIVDWSLSLDWPAYDDNDYLKTETDLYSMLDEILKIQVLAMPDKHKFDSRTYVRPKKRTQRPSIQSIVEVSSPPSVSPNSSLSQPSNKYLTYNKYNAPLGPILRLKTFNVDTNTENSTAVKELLKRRSLVQDDDTQLEDENVTLVSDASDRVSSEHVPSKPINIDLSQPANNLHNTFNKGLTNLINERGSLNMYQSGESLMRMSPPSLVSSLLMENSGTFNHESMDSRKSMLSHRDSGYGVPMSGRDSIDPMMTSMTLSILDEKDMSTSFLSQTTYPDNDSLMDSLPPSLVSSVNSSYVVSNTSKPRADSVDSNNIFSSATFTHLEQSEKLLSARPRVQNMFNSFTKRDSPAIKNSESYTKAREEACQIQLDGVKILNENSDKKDPLKMFKPGTEMGETVTLHYSNMKFRRNHDAEKENLNTSFEKDDTFYKEMGIQRPSDAARNSLNITLDKQELNEIIQARQKLSLARKALPNEPERSLPNQVEACVKTIPVPNQAINVPKKSMENASELISRRRGFTNGLDRPEEPIREPPKRNATFKKPSPRANSVDTTVVFVKADETNIIDINSATMNLIDASDKTLQQEDWGSQERAMVGSSESTDTGTFSSSSPPESGPDSGARNDPRSQVASTPLASLRKVSKHDLLNLHTTISPIYDMVDDKSYTLARAPCANSYETHNTTVINSATIVKKASAKRDILAGKVSPEKKMLGPSVQQKSPRPPRVIPAASYNSMAPPSGALRKTSLPTSKLRQYSSHKDLRIPVSAAGSSTSVARAPAGRCLVRRGVYASNPALSPTASAPAARRDSYTIAPADQPCEKEDGGKPTVPPRPPPLVRQGTETLRRERPQSQLVQPKDLRGGAVPTGVPVQRSHYQPPPTTRPYSIAGSTQLRISRPTAVPLQKPYSAGERSRYSAPTPPEMMRSRIMREKAGCLLSNGPAVEAPRSAPATETRVSALPRPTRLPAPRRGLRPPSVYTVAPSADLDQY